MESEYRKSKIKIIGVSEENMTNGTGKTLKIIIQRHCTEIKTNSNLWTEITHYFWKS